MASRSPYCWRMVDSKSNRTTPHYSSLEGLSGLAALVVLIHHCFLASPQLSAAADSNGTLPFDWWVWTTFASDWAGKEAVYVFFTLSGFVLTLLFIGNARPNWAPTSRNVLSGSICPFGPPYFSHLAWHGLFPHLAAPELSSSVKLHDEPPNISIDALLLWGVVLSTRRPGRCSGK